MRVTSGLDWQANILGNTSSNGTGAYAPATYIAVTADGTTPSASDTALSGEVVSGSLVRAQATYSHTPGATYYTRTHTFVSDQTILLKKIATFNDPSSGTMFTETLLDVPRQLYSGDSITITETVNL